MRLPIGVTRAEALQRLGTPTAIYPMPNGYERLQYSRAPSGYEVNNVDIDATGHVYEVRQELSDDLFDSTVKTGVWHVDDVLRTYGRPFQIDRVTSFDGVIWTWRYRSMNTPRFFYIYIDPAGVVQRYHTGDDLTLDLVDR